MDRIIHLLARTQRRTSRTLLSQSTRPPSSTTCRLLPIASPMSPTIHLRTPALEACLATFADQASPTGCEPKAQEQFEDFALHNFAPIQGDSLTSSNSSFSGSMKEVVAPSTELFDPATRDWSRRQDSGHRFSPTEDWSSRENQFVQKSQTIFSKKNQEALARHSRTDAAATAGSSKKSPY